MGMIVCGLPCIPALFAFVALGGGWECSDLMLLLVLPYVCAVRRVARLLGLSGRIFHKMYF